MESEKVWRGHDRTWLGTSNNSMCSSTLQYPNLAHSHQGDPDYIKALFPPKRKLNYSSTGLETKTLASSLRTTNWSYLVLYPFPVPEKSSNPKRNANTDVLRMCHPLSSYFQTHPIPHAGNFFPSHLTRHHAGNMQIHCTLRRAWNGPLTWKPLLACRSFLALRQRSKYRDRKVSDSVLLGTLWICSNLVWFDTPSVLQGHL